MPVDLESPDQMDAKACFGMLPLPYNRHDSLYDCSSLRTASRPQARLGMGNLLAIHFGQRWHHHDRHYRLPHLLRISQ